MGKANGQKLRPLSITATLSVVVLPYAQQGVDLRQRPARKPAQPPATANYRNNFNLPLLETDFLVNGDQNLPSLAGQFSRPSSPPTNSRKHSTNNPKRHRPLAEQLLDSLDMIEFATL